MEILFIVGMAVRFAIGLVTRIVGKVFVGSWRNRIERRLSRAIITSDFGVNFVTGTDPPVLQFIFKIHNGSISAITLKRIVVNLYGGDAYITGIAGSISDISLVSVPSTRVAKGKDVNVAVEIVPSLEFWLPPRATSFSLRKSSIAVSAVWGDVVKPLEPDLMQDNTNEFEGQIDDYVSRVRRSLSVQLT